MTDKFTAESEKVRLEVVRVCNRWWIDGLPDNEPMGPYDTKGEAEADRRGVERFYGTAFTPKGEAFVHGPKMKR